MARRLAFRKSPTPRASGPGPAGGGANLAEIWLFGILLDSPTPAIWHSAAPPRLPAPHSTCSTPTSQPPTGAHPPLEVRPWPEAAVRFMQRKTSSCIMHDGHPWQLAPAIHSRRRATGPRPRVPVHPPQPGVWAKSAVEWGCAMTNAPFTRAPVFSRSNGVVLFVHVMGAPPGK
jgi:hypothetical protein